MIDPRKLRIGNIVLHDEIICEIDGIQYAEITISNLRGNSMWDTKLENISPIPLTEEWFLKMGFEKNTEGHFKTSNLHSLFVKIGHGVEPVWVYANGTDRPQLKYVHTLQNFYHALTGQELTIKQ